MGAQEQLAALSTNAVHLTVESTHAGMVEDVRPASEAVRAITEVLASVHTADAHLPLTGSCAPTQSVSGRAGVCGVSKATCMSKTENHPGRSLRFVGGRPEDGELGLPTGVCWGRRRVRSSARRRLVRGGPRAGHAAWRWPQDGQQPDSAGHVRTTSRDLISVSRGSAIRRSAGPRELEAAREGDHDDDTDSPDQSAAAQAGADRRYRSGAGPRRVPRCYWAPRWPRSSPCLSLCLVGVERSLNVLMRTPRLPGSDTSRASPLPLA